MADLDPPEDDPTRRFAALARFSHSMTLVLSEEGRVLWASPSVQTMLSHDPGEWIDSRFVDLLHPGDMAMWSAEFRRLRRGSTHASLVAVRLQQQDTTWRWFEVVLTDLLGDPDVAGIVVEARQVSSRLDRMTTRPGWYGIDELTGLPDRSAILRLLRDHIERASADHPVSVAIMDVDRFHIVNDALGYKSGDRMIQAVAARLREHLGADGVLGRLGADEFAFIPEFGVAGPDVRQHLAARVQHAFREPVRVAQTPVACSMGIGMAITPDPNTAPGDLLAKAGAALNHAKEIGPGAWRIFDSGMRDRMAAELSQAEVLRRALDEDRVLVHYQPIVSAQTRRLLGVEALARIQDPELGTIGPVDFIPVAEATGMIAELGDRVLTKACCETASAWPGTTGPRVSVNMSGQQLLQPDLPVRVGRMLSRCGLTPSRLKLEITESQLTEPTHAPHVLDELSSLGVGLCIDDFGTGWSSLRRLVRVRVDSLKIDPSFTAGFPMNPTSAKVVRAVLALASALGIDTVVEGVETEQQAAALAADGADALQGFLFGRPGSLRGIARRYTRGWTSDLIPEPPGGIPRQPGPLRSAQWDPSGGSETPSPTAESNRSGWADDR